MPADRQSVRATSVLHKYFCPLEPPEIEASTTGCRRRSLTVRNRLQRKAGRFFTWQDSCTDAPCGDRDPIPAATARNGLGVAQPSWRATGSRSRWRRVLSSAPAADRHSQVWISISNSLQRDFLHEILCVCNRRALDLRSVSAACSGERSADKTGRSGGPRGRTLRFFTLSQRMRSSRLWGTSLRNSGGAD
jgi:hypothetical protein